MKIAFRLVLIFVIVAAVFGLGAFAYRAGFMQAASQNWASMPEGKLMPQGDYHSYGMLPYSFHRSHFSIFGFLAPLFFLFLIFAALRGLFWRIRWGHSMHHFGHGDRQWDHEKGVPPFFNEWHNRAHAANETPQAPVDAQKPTE